MMCHNEIVTWATPQNIRMIHFGKKQKICIIERPKKPHFPDYLFVSNAIKPTMIWKKEEGSGADLFIVGWFNLIKICKLIQRPEDSRYVVDVIRK